VRGRIQRALSGFYYVKCADGQLYTCKARGKFRREGISPLVGDDVEFCEVPGGEGRSQSRRTGKYRGYGRGDCRARNRGRAGRKPAGD